MDCSVESSSRSSACSVESCSTETPLPHQEGLAPWMRRLQSREDGLRQLFDLPRDTTLMDEFSCALRRKVLLQGKMYVFDRYLCFYSNLFGIVRTRVVEFKDIIAVRKKTHLRFPNSIQVEHQQGKDFFTSFFYRDDAYELIDTTWKESRSSITPPSGPSGQEELPSAFNDQAGLDEYDLHVQPSGQSCALDQDLPPSGRPFSAFTPLGREEDDDGSSEGERTWWNLSAGSAPPLRRDSIQLGSTTLPATPRTFFLAILSNGSNFLINFLEHQGEKRVNISDWQRHEDLGHVRDVQFVSPVRSTLVTSGHLAQCLQSQRFGVYEGGHHLVMETSQTMMGIPYGDCFKVETRWDVVAKARPQDRLEPEDEASPEVEVVLHMWIPFSKNIPFLAKKAIQHNAHKQCKASMMTLLEEARCELTRYLGCQAMSPAATLPDTLLSCPSAEVMSAALQAVTHDLNGSHHPRHTRSRSSVSAHGAAVHLSNTGNVAEGLEDCREGSSFLDQLVIPHLKTFYQSFTAQTQQARVHLRTITKKVLVPLSPPSFIGHVHFCILVMILLQLVTWYSLLSRVPMQSHPPTVVEQPVNLSSSSTCLGESLYWARHLETLQNQLQLLQTQVKLVNQEIQLAKEMLGSRS